MTSELKKWEIAEPGDTNLRLVTPSGHVLAKSYSSSRANIAGYCRKDSGKPPADNA